MRILLQQTGTSLYFKSLEIWTANPQEALDFYVGERARNFATEQHLSEVNVVVFPEIASNNTPDSRGAAVRPVQPL
jgi:hypothetical protein